MTAKKDLKRRVRERMRATGEAYTVALARVRAEAPAVAGPRRSVISSLHDLTPLARSSGFSCFVEVGHDAWGRVEAVEPAEAWFAKVLGRIRQLVLAVSGERGARDLATALFDESARPPRPPPLGRADPTALMRFMNLVASGVRGIAPTGDALAIDVASLARPSGQPRLVQGTILPGYGPRRPTLILSIDPPLDVLRWGLGRDLHVTGPWSGR
jgi:hypothetical protein